MRRGKEEQDLKSICRSSKNLLRGLLCSFGGILETRRGDLDLWELLGISWGSLGLSFACLWGHLGGLHGAFEIAHARQEASSRKYKQPAAAGSKWLEHGRCSISINPDSQCFCQSSMAIFLASHPQLQHLLEPPKFEKPIVVDAEEHSLGPGSLVEALGKKLKQLSAPIHGDKKDLGSRLVRSNFPTQLGPGLYPPCAGCGEAVPLVNRTPFYWMCVSCQVHCLCDNCNWCARCEEEPGGYEKHTITFSM